METQTKDSAIYKDEINLYDCWKVIVKRKKLIIGLFLVATFASAIISFLMPKIYRVEAVLKLPEKQTQSLMTMTAKELTAKELISIIGRIDKEKQKNILPKTHHSITDLKLNALKDSADKIQLIIEAKNKDILPQAVVEFLTYINSNTFINQYIEEERQRLLLQLEQISKT